MADHLGVIKPNKIAVATKDGISVNVHFGHAKMFWVYQLLAGGVQLLEKREVDHYCHGQVGDQSAMQKILASIKDCDVMLCAKIGDGPRQKLENIGVQAVADYAYEAIDEAVKNFLEASV